MKRNTKNGSALAIAIVFSVVLLQLALVYSKQVSNTTASTQQIDERVRLQYLADGITQIALLKFQKFPSDYYYAWDYRTIDPSYFNSFTTNAEEFKKEAFDNDQDQPESILSKGGKIKARLISMNLETTSAQKWEKEVLSIRTEAKYNNVQGKELTADSVLTVKTERTVIK